MNFILYRAQRFFAIQRRGSKTSFIREERKGGEGKKSLRRFEDSVGENRSAAKGMRRLDEG